jgi:AraC-like DNA-binding protein
MFYYFGIGINFFLLFILLSKRGKTLADKILAAWLFIIGLHHILFVLSIQPITLSNIYLIGLAAPIPLLHGPFLYLYTAASTNNLPAKRSVWAVHFLPALIAIIYLTPVYVMTAQQKMDFYLSGAKGYKTGNAILLILIQLSGLIYVAWSFYLLRKHKKNIGDQFSYEEKINLNWLRYLIYGLLLVWCVIIIIRKSPVIFGGGVIFITLLGFFGIRQVGIFSQQLKSKLNEPVMDEHIKQPEEIITATPVTNEINTTDEILAEVLPVKKKKYANSGLTVEMANEIHEQLTRLMTEEKLYTEPELSLVALAAKLNIHPNYLSQVINEKESKSFFDYINTLRVQEFIRLVRLPQNSRFTILSLAYDCGFNAKSSFNKNFKKVTGQSPTEFLAGNS